MSVLRLLFACALLVIGACAAVAATLIHERWWGLALGLGAAASVTRALPAGSRKCAFMFGWFGAISYTVLPRAEGDFLIAASPGGYGFIAGSFVIFLAALASLSGLPRRGSRPRREGEDLRHRDDRT